MTTEQKATMIVTLCIVLAGGIVALDLALPLGVAAGVPYVGVVLVSLWLPRPQHVLYTAVAVSALIVAGYVWSEPSGMQWMVLANRFLALFAIWATALVGFQRQRIEASMQTETDELEQLYRTAPVALAVFDQDLRFLRLNDQMAALNGLPLLSTWVEACTRLFPMWLSRPNRSCGRRSSPVGLCLMSS